MPVVALCPRCRAVLSGAASGEHCRRCGENVVASRRALCAHCGRDVTGALRVKDAAGEFYCPDCWLELNDAAGREALYPCSSCGQWQPTHQTCVQGTHYVCKPCLAHRDFDPDALLAAAAEATGGEPDAFQPAVVTFSEVRRRRAEEKMRRMILWMSCAGAVVVAALITVLAVAGR